MKKITAILLSGAMLTGMVSVLPVSAEDAFGAVDFVAVHKYLHGKHNLTPEEFRRYDSNQDGTVNIFDLISVKKEIIGNRITLNLHDFRTDAVSACREDVWVRGLQREQHLLTSAEEFETLLNSCFRPEVVRAFQKRYDAGFFTEQNLLLVFGCGTDENSKASVTVTQIPLSKNQELSGIRIQPDENQIPCEFMTYDRDSESMSENPYNEPMSEIPYYGENQLIDTYEKYQHLLESYEYNLPVAYRNYPEEFFETKALYLNGRSNYYPTDSKRAFYSIEKSDNQIVITTVQKSNKNDFYTNFCDIITFNKADIEGCDIQVQTIDFKQNEPAGTTIYYAFPEKYDTDGNDRKWQYLAVNYNTFEDETQLTFWKTSSPISVIRHLEWKDLYTEEVLTGEFSGENPFSNMYEVNSIIDENSNVTGISYISETFSITWSDSAENTVIVQYRNPDGSKSYHALPY